MSYELFYSYGGHGGPYMSMSEAEKAAVRLLKGSKSLAFVSIVERTHDSVSGYGRIVKKIKKEEIKS